MAVTKEQSCGEQALNRVTSTVSRVLLSRTIHSERTDDCKGKSEVFTTHAKGKIRNHVLVFIHREIGFSWFLK